MPECVFMIRSATCHMTKRIGNHVSANTKVSQDEIIVMYEM